MSGEITPGDVDVTRYTCLFPDNRDCKFHSDIPGLDRWQNHFAKNPLMFDVDRSSGK
jgi:hypothetical protein